MYLIILILLVAQSNIKEMLERAKKLQESQQDSRSLVIYNNVLEIDSLNNEALRESSIVLCRLGFNSDDDELQLSYYSKAVKRSKKALELDFTIARNYLVAARSLGRLAEISGAKQRLKWSVKIKEYAEKAVALDPENDIAYHIIGRWNYKISDLSWVEKLAANTVLGGVPEGASFENAEKAYQHAMMIKPKAISHRLELAKTYVELGKDEEAISLLKETVQLPPIQSIDDKYLKEAKSLLDDLN